MANEFKLVTKTGNATLQNTDIEIFQATTTTVLIGLSVANLINNSIMIDLKLESSTGTNVNIYIGKELPVPAGSSLNALTGKIVLQTGDKLVVSSNTSLAMDIALSIMEIT